MELMIDSLKLDNIANKIREKNGETDKYSLDMMVSKIDELGGGTDDTIAVAMVNRDITNLRLDGLTELHTTRYTSNYFFGYNNYIHGILYDVVGVFLQNLVYIYDGWNLEGANFTHLYVPKLETISYSNNGYMLAHNSKIVNFVAPSLTTAHNLVVSGYCKRIVAPDATTSRKYSFVNDDYDNTQNTNLELIDVKSAPSIRGKMNALKTIIIRKTTNVVPLDNTGNVANLEAVYVPSALVSSYKSASNWSTYGSLIQPIEGSKYESKIWYESEQWYQDELDYWDNLYSDFN